MTTYLFVYIVIFWLASPFIKRVFSNQNSSRFPIRYSNPPPPQKKIANLSSLPSTFIFNRVFQIIIYPQNSICQFLKAYASSGSVNPAGILPTTDSQTHVNCPQNKIPFSINYKKIPMVSPHTLRMPFILRLQ